jgi:predicted RNA-binding Zn-ribbon protein involved in translation (DUF1610 family)
MKMAYGKDPKVLGNAGSFRQRANQYQQQKEAARPKGGGGLPYFVGQYKPSIADVDTIRVIEGHYQVPQLVGRGDDAHIEMVELPFYPYAEHYDGREKKSSICSAGPYFGSKDKASPCHGCDIFWTGMERGADGKKKQGRMSRRELYAFTVVDYGTYHEVQQVDRRTGQVRVNENTGQPYTEWVKCEGQGCDACQAGAPTRRGAKRHWPLGWGHYQTLLAADKQIGKSCSSCGGVDTVKCIAWCCPQCGEAIIDMRTSTMKQKDIDEVVENSAHCNSCGFEGFLQEIIECTQCTPAGGTAKRATIFDVDMNVQRIESSDGGNQTTLTISKWSAPRPLDPAFKEFGEPMDLAKTYAPTALDKQADLFKVPAGGVRKPVTASEAARPYNQQNPYKQG